MRKAILLFYTGLLIASLAACSSKTKKADKINYDMPKTIEESVNDNSNSITSSDAEITNSTTSSDAEITDVPAIQTADCYSEKAL